MGFFAKTVAVAIMLTTSVVTFAADRLSSVMQPGLVPQGNCIFLVFANAVEGKDAEFNIWYDAHAAAITKLPGYVRSQRFIRQSRAGKPDPAFGYVTMYEFSGDPDTVIGGVGKAVKDGLVKSPDPTIVAKLESMVYKASQPGFVH